MLMCADHNLGQKASLLAFRGINMLSTLMPIAMAEKISCISPLIPYYHLVSDERVIHVCHLYRYKNRIQFSRDVDFLCGRYDPLSIHDLVDFVKHGKKLKKESFLLTFDDGFSQNYSIVAPILFKKGIPALFFLSTDFIDNKALCYRSKASILIDFLLSNECFFHKIKQSMPHILDVSFQDMPERILSIRYNDQMVIERLANLCGINYAEYLQSNQPYLSSWQIRKMIEMGFFFGAHSLDHPLYADLSLEQQLNQTRGSLEFIKREFDLPYSLFAFPHNDTHISKEYFIRIKKYTDLTFGAAGFKIDSVTTNLQRINFEKTLEPAKKILKHELIKKRIYQALKRAEIVRV